MINGIGNGIGFSRVEGTGGTPVDRPIASPATNIQSTAFQANWQLYPGAVSYELDVSTDPYFGTYVYKSLSTTDTFFGVVGLTLNQTYYYRVRGIMTGGGVSLNSNVIMAVTSASTFDADYQAVLDYATTQGYTLPSASQQTLQNQLVVDLKDGGIWSKLDTFGVFATDGDSDFALIDWIRLTDYTAVNSPTFTTNQGFQGDGVSAYIDTNYNISTDAVNFSQDDACFGGWRFNNIVATSRFIGATVNTSLREGNTVVHRINQSVNNSSNMTGSGIGLRVLNRTNSSDIQMIVNNTLETSTATSSGVPSSNLHLLSRGDGTSFSISEISISLAGSNLVSERIDLYNALNDYMTSI